MNFVSSVHLFLAVTFLSAASCLQEVFHIKSQDCEQRCSCPSPACITLTEYAQNSTYPRSSVMLILYPGKHKLTKDFVIENAFDFSLVAAEPLNKTTINCGLVAAFRFENITDLALQSVAFVSCGKGSPEMTPEISMSNVAGLSLVNVTLSGSVSGALYLANSCDVTIHGLSVVSNLNSASTIVQFKNSEVKLTGTTTISNNSIGELSKLECGRTDLMEAVIFHIEEGDINVENLMVSNNTSPSGVVRVTDNALSADGIWIFKLNRVCVGGSLSLNSLSMRFNGSLTFTNNSVSSQNCSGVLIRDSNFDITGDMAFLFNEGHIVAMDSVSSNTTVVGSLSITQNTAERGVVLALNSFLHITGLLNLSDNAFSHWGMRVEFNSKLMVEGETICVGNLISTPLIFFFGNATLSGFVTVSNNPGVMYAFVAFINITGTSKFTNNTLEDDYLDGTIALERSTLALSGDYLFDHNQLHAANKNGGALFATLSCTISLEGNGTFFNNSARYGGAIYLDQMSSINIKKGTNLVFSGNQAIRGAALYIQTSLRHVECSFESIPCLFQFPDNTPTGNEISLNFTNNRGNPGGSVIHANIENINFEIENQTFPAIDNLHKVIILPDQSNTEPNFYSESYLFCFCKIGAAQECERDRTKTVRAIKGKHFPLSVRALRFYGDDDDEPVRSNLKSSLNSGENSSSRIVSMLDGCFQVVQNHKCTKLDFTVNSPNQSETIVLNIGESSLDIDKTLYVDIVFEDSCPLGFSFTEGNDQCVCEPKIAQHLEMCDLTKEMFKKKSSYSNFWIGSLGNDSLLLYDSCPRGYCIANSTFSLSNDSICDNNRAGRLCGECIEGFSLLLGGRLCEDCSGKNSYLALLIVFAALGVILVAVIFLIQFTVTTGIINGLLLYMNIVHVNQSLFFTPEFFRGYTISISWLNLDFGIETCFYDGLNQAQYAGWQFAFPLYLWLIAGGIVIICRYSVRASKFFGNNDPVAVLATIILLTYNTMIQNIVAIVNIAHLVTPDGTRIPTWLYNGNIGYVAGSHLVLMIVALAFLVFLFCPYTLVLTTAQLLQKFEFTSRILRRFRLDPFLHAYQVPFKPAHRYWVGLCLMMRALLLVMFALVESEKGVFLAIITFCVISLSMHGVAGGVYAEHWHNVLEISFIFNLGMFSAVQLYLLESNDILAYISVTISFVTFIGIIVFHVYKRLKKQHKVRQIIASLKNKFKIKKKLKREVEEDESLQIQGTIGTAYRVELREPLLESESES